MEYLHDLLLGLRMLLRRPGFCTIVIICLALGIGPNVAMFSIINAVLLRPLPIKDIDGVAWMGSNSGPNLLDLQGRMKSVSQMAGYKSFPGNISGAGWRMRASVNHVFPSYLEVLGIQPILGRNFLPEEMKAGQENVVILSCKVWKDRFEGDREVIGKTLKLDRAVYTIVGVLPHRANLDGEDVLIPYTDQRLQAPRDRTVIDTIARLAPGATIEQLKAELKLQDERLADEYPKENQDLDNHTWTMPIRKYLLGDTGLVFWMLQGGMGLPLLIACANVGSLLLARAQLRNREMALRSALGGSRLRIIRQLLAEGLVLSLLGGAIGVLLAKCVLNGILALAPERLEDVSIDWVVLAFTLGLCVAATLIFGLAPAIHASKVDLASALKEGGAGMSGGRRRHRTLGALAVGEVALAVVLLVAAVLLVLNVHRLSKVNLGFNPDNLLTGLTRLTTDKSSGRQNRIAFLAELHRRLKSIPGVVEVGGAEYMPMRWSDARQFTIEGRQMASEWERIERYTPGFAEALQVPLLRGRFFRDSDTADAPPVAVINSSLARELWPNEDPIGQYILLEDRPPATVRCEVVGIMDDIAYYGPKTRRTIGSICVSFWQLPMTHYALAIRTAGPPGQLTGKILDTINQMDPDLPVELTDMRQVVKDRIRLDRFVMFLAVMLAAIGLVLASAGVAGLLAYSVSQRTREISIRMAMGASAPSVQWLFVRRGLVLTLVGIAIGLAAALALARITQGFMFGLSLADPWAIAAVCAVLAVVALLSVAIPTRRATKVDPMAVLRYE
jgi:putative ABC transport system permease protein